MGVDLTVGDRVYVHTKGRVMTVQAIILPGDEFLELGLSKQCYSSQIKG